MTDEKLIGMIKGQLDSVIHIIMPDQILAYIASRNEAMAERWRELLMARVNDLTAPDGTRRQIGTLLHNDHSKLMTTDGDKRTSPDEVLYFVIYIKNEHNQDYVPDKLFVLDFAAGTVTDRSDGLVNVH